MFFLFFTAVISLLITSLAIYLLCKHKKLSILEAKSCPTASKRSRGSNNTGRVHYRMQNSELYNFGINCYNFQSIDVSSSTLQKMKAVQGACMFSNAVKIIIFILDVQYYVPVKLCKTAESIHLFKISGMIKPENVKLNQNYIWDTIEMD